MIKLFTKALYYKQFRENKIGRVIDIIEFLVTTLIFIATVYIIGNFISPEKSFINIQLYIFYFATIVAWYVLSRISEMAKLPRTQRYITLIFNSAKVHFIVLIGLTFFSFLLGLESISILFIITLVTWIFVTNTIVRFLIFKLLKLYRAYGFNIHNVVLLADGFSEQVIETLTSEKEWGFKIVGIVTRSRLINAKYGDHYKIYSENENLKDIIDKNIVDEVIYCKSTYKEDQVAKYAEICNEVGVIFRLQSSVSPLEPIEFQLKSYKSKNTGPLVDVPSNNFSLLVKNMSDMYFSIMAVLLLSPVFLFIALLIKADSKGPVFFTQERVGLRGRKFKLYKFRTMVNGADRMIDKLKDKNQADGPVFKITHDPRITRIGLILRKSGLDELPQLLNVIKGEMSLVGPRPPLQSEVEKYKRWQLRRLSVKPGITCSWQIVPNRNDVKFDKWMQMDLHYIDNWTLFSDLSLAFRTVTTIFKAGGR